jgi:hypothetical protein
LTIKIKLAYQPRPDSLSKYDSIIVDIEGKRMSLRFEVSAGKVFLRQKTEPELAHIVDKPFDPTELLYLLRKSGINLLPSDEDAETCNIPLKNLMAEHKAADDISIAAKSFYVSSNKWNCSMDPNQILVKMRYNPECDEEFLEDQEKDWMAVSWWDNKCEVLRTRESQDEPAKKRIKGTLTHTSFYTLVKNLQLHEVLTFLGFGYNKNRRSVSCARRRLLRITSICIMFWCIVRCILSSSSRGS